MYDKIENIFMFFLIVAAAFAFAMGGENNLKKDLKVCQEAPKR